MFLQKAPGTCPHLSPPRWCAVHVCPKHRQPKSSRFQAGSTSSSCLFSQQVSPPPSPMAGYTCQKVPAWAGVREKGRRTEVGWWWGRRATGDKQAKATKVLVRRRKCPTLPPFSLEKAQYTCYIPLHVCFQSLLFPFSPFSLENLLLFQSSRSLSPPSSACKAVRSMVKEAEEMLGKMPLQPSRRMQCHLSSCPCPPSLR